MKVKKFFITVLVIFSILMIKDLIHQKRMNDYTKDLKIKFVKASTKVNPEVVKHYYRELFGEDLKIYKYNAEVKN